jgi:hypothetical protein
MSVRVDAAGQQQEAGCVDDCVCGGGWNPRTDFLDGRAIDQQIGLSGRVRADDGCEFSARMRSMSLQA